MPLPLGFVPQCLPTKAPQPPAGAAWLHEIKHDGFRVVARKRGVVSCAGESPVILDNTGGHIVGLKPDSLLMNYGSRQGPLQ